METTNYTFNYDNREVCPCDSLPEVLKPVKDFNALCNEYGVELEALYANVSKILNEQFITTASEDTIAKFEKHLNVIPPATNTIDERRFRILALLNDSPPYTDEYLSNKLNELCGRSNWRMFKEYDSYRLLIELSTNSMSNTETIMKLVRDFIPANINLSVSEYLTRYYNLNVFTHDDLNRYTHEELRYLETLN